MRTNNSSIQPLLRHPETGAVLVVVLLAMIALLGMGITGLYLTTGSIQMSANINMRNQALYVAEAGIQTAKSVLNRTLPGNAAWSPDISAMLSGNSPSQVPVALPDGVVDEIPGTPDACLGTSANGNPTRGAILRDDNGFGCGNGTLAYVNCNYPNNAGAAYNAPTGDTQHPAPPTQFMGNYTLYIRQDLAECRMGSYTTELAPPLSNGIVVIRSEGVASDNRTKVVLEVTMTPNSNAIVVNNRVATVCPAGAAGCDDNASVQQGITVAGALTPPPPGAGSMAGSSGAGGAGGTGGEAGSTGGGAGSGTTSPLAGSTGGSTGGAVGGSTGGTGGSGGTGTGGTSVPGCIYNKCNVIATIGIYGFWDGNYNCATKVPKADIMDKWLAKHSDTCHITSFDLEDTTITPADLAPFKVILMLDVRHTKAERTARIQKICTGNDWVSAYPGNSNPDLLSDSEANAIADWVKSGGSLITTLGYENTAAETAPMNKVLKQLGVVYSANATEYHLFPWNTTFLTAAAGNFSNKTPIANVLTANVNTVQVSGVCGVRGWDGTQEVSLFQTTSPYARVTSGAFAESSSFSVFSQGTDSGTPHAVGVAKIVNAGRLLAWGDEWITYDTDWKPDPTHNCDKKANPSSPGWDSTANACNQYFWDNIMKWLTANCIP